MVGYTAIYAPFSGVITARKADPGSMAMPQMPILAMDDDALYQLVSQAPERLAAKLTHGARVMVRIDSFNATLPATIVDIVPSAIQIRGQVMYF
jgi:multidrug resistance efflux pump